MQKINELKSIETFSRGTSELVINIYFLQIGAILFSLLFGSSGVYGFIFKIILFVEIDCVPPDFQYIFLGLNLLLLPSLIFYPPLVSLLKLYPYILSLPIFIDSLQSFDLSNPPLAAVCLANLALNLLIMRLSYLLYMSYSFISSHDFLADRNLWWLKIIFPYLLIGARYFGFALVGGIGTFLYSIMVLVREMFEFNYVVKHEGYILVSAMTLFSTMIWFSYYFSGSQQVFGTMTLVLVLGLFVSRLIAKELILYVRHQAVYSSDIKTFKKCQDTVRFMFEVKRQYIEQKQNRKKYYGVLANHFSSCVNPDCKCKSIDLSMPQSVHGFYNQLLLDILSKPTDNITQQRIVLIYYFMQIICQPFRAFFEATKLTKQKLSILNKIQVMLIVQEARFKVDVLLREQKATNQDLQVVKVQRFERQLSSLKEKFILILRQLTYFLEHFLSKNMSIRKMQDCASELNKRRKQIDQIIDDLHKINPNSRSLIGMIKIYYQYFEIYDSKVAAFEKVRHDFTMEQRLFHTDQKTMFDEDHGVLTIDLAENIGKVQYISKNIATMFELKPDQMMGTNLQTYMPDHHGSQHTQILKNFIEKGSVKVLNQSNIFFGLNQNGFIFPMELKIKIQTHSAQNFRATALIRNMRSKNGYILTSEQGVCLQISHTLYKTMFFQLFQDDTQKLRQHNIKLFLPELYRKDLQVGVTYSGYFLIPQKIQAVTQRLPDARSQGMVPTLSNRSNSGMINLSTLSNNQSKNQLIRWFECINFRRINGFRIKYRLSKIDSTYFKSNVIEIESIKECFKDRPFYKKMFTWLAKVCEIMDVEEYRTKMVTARKVIKTFTSDDDLEVLDGVNVELADVVSLPEEESNSIETETVDDESIESQKSDEYSLQNERIYIDSGQASEKSSVGSSSVDYTLNKRQLVVDGFKQSENSDYIPIQRMIYLFVAAVIVLKFVALAQKLIFSGYQKNEDVSNSYLQRISRSFYYYCAFREVSNLYENDTKLFPLLQNQITIEEKLFKNELENNQKLNQQERQLFGFDPLLSPTGIHSTQKELSIQYLNFVQILNEISVQAATMMITKTYKPDFTRKNYIDLIKIFQSLKANYYTLKNKTIQTKMSFSLNFTIVCQTIYLLFFSVSIPIYMYYNRRKLKLLAFMGFFPYRTVKSEIKFFKQLQAKMIEDAMTDESSYVSEEVVSSNQQDEGNLLKANKLIVDGGVRDENAMMLFSDIENNKRGFIAMVVGFFFLYSVLNWSIWGLAYVFDLQTQSSLDTQINFNVLGTQTPLVVYAFVSNMNNVKGGNSMNEDLYSIFNQTVYYDVLQSQFRRTPQTQYINDTMSMLVSGYCPECSGILSKGYFDNVKSIYKKFYYFVQSNFSTFTPTDIDSWMISQNLADLSVNLVKLRDWILQLYQKLDQTNQYEFKTYQTLFVIFIIGNSILTGILGYFMQKVYISEICVMINQTENLFKNMSVNIITENTQLINYFREKLRKK